MTEHIYIINDCYLDREALIDTIRRKKALIEKTGHPYSFEEKTAYELKDEEGYKHEYVAEDQLSDEDIIFMIEKGSGNYLDLKKQDEDGLFSYIKQEPEIVQVKTINLYKAEKSIRETIGTRISDIRDKRGYTQDQLASRAGIDRSNLSKIEAGKYNVRVDTLEKICSALGCRLDIVEDYTLSNID